MSCQNHDTANTPNQHFKILSAVSLSFLVCFSVKHTSKTPQIKAASIHPLTAASIFFFLPMCSGASTPERLSRWKGSWTTRMCRGPDTCSEASMSLTQPSYVRQLWVALEKTKEWRHVSSLWWKTETGFPSAYTCAGGQGELSIRSINTQRRGV